MEPTTRVKRNFLEAVQRGAIVQYDRTTLWHYSGDDTEEVTPLIEWAVYADLVADNWHCRFPGDSCPAVLTERGEAELGRLNEMLRGW